MNIDSHDLTLTTDKGILNIRVLILLEPPKGYIFEKHEDGYYFAIGGRVKFNENSEDAAHRELQEEIHNDNIELNLKGIIENFFKVKGENYHEINFVYYGKLEKEMDLTSLHSDHVGFCYLTPKEAKALDVRPKVLLQALGSKDFQHLIN